MTDQTDNLIEFHCDPTQDVPRPYPAAGATPDWLKKMPLMDFEPAPEALLRPQVAATVGLLGPQIAATVSLLGPQFATLKRCAPFIEAMTCGYVIPLAHEVRFFMRDATCLSFEETAPVVTFHPQMQYEGAPFAGKAMVKFLNPWIIKTPLGYSTLFTPLLNQFDSPFQILAGVVETDTYYRQVLFPAVCLMHPGERCVLPRGTPLVQAIPIKRESWQSAYSAIDRARSDAICAGMAANTHFYKDTLWVKKNYK